MCDQSFLEFWYWTNSDRWHIDVPSGKLTKNNEKSQFLMGKLTISMTIFNSFLYVYQAG